MSRKVGLKKNSKPLRRKTKLKKVRLDTIGKLKRTLWQLCREIIIKQYGTTCFTCTKEGLQGSNLHTGHFIPSSVCSAALRYDLDNLRPQCYACNIWKSGNWIEYESHLIADGIDIAALKARNQATKGMQADRIFYNNKIAEYTALKANLPS